MTTKIWKLRQPDATAVNQLQQDLNIHAALCKLLVTRGIKDFESARLFFRPSLSHLHNPFLMKDMSKAVTRIEEALKHQQKIMIYGDYDVDGTTAVAVVYSFLHKNFPDAVLEYYVPHRYREGYGISQAGIDYAKSIGIALIITLDCGIKSTEKIAYAQSLGMDVIVCDHHNPDENDIPPAYAILNPKQQQCNYPYKELSGCGIGYKLISALAHHYQLPPQSCEQYLDLVATSIAADIVPMNEENRILAYYGMLKANSNPSLSLATIKEIAGVDRNLTIADLVFVIAPKINAAGRMDDARHAIAFFIEENQERAYEMAMNLHANNYDRREIDKSMTEEALGILQTSEAMVHSKATILYRPHWHKGVVGIVASRLIDHYYKPTVVLTESNGKITGSARSVNGFNIYDALHQCSELLENYGGHFFAAGMTLPAENLNAFSEKFEQVVANNIQPESLTPVIDIDVEIELKDISTAFYNIIKQFEPFGPTNLRPVFLSKNVINYNNQSRVVKDMHIRFSIHQLGSKKTITGIGFGLVDKFPIIASNEPFDIIYTNTLQIKVIDVRPAMQ
jgi:single-stranded-DNA-specific exonuclease